MKKRILAALLAVCLLASLFPVATTAAEQAQVAVADRAASDYLDLYVKDGLIVLFDAGTASTDTIDLAAGTWTGMTVSNGALVKNEAYQATLGGGAYHAESNPTGWRSENGALVWREPDSMSANRYLRFDPSWLPDVFEVEVLFAPYLRDYYTDRQENITATKISEDTEKGTVTYLLNRSTGWNSADLAHAKWTISLSGTAAASLALEKGGWGTSEAHATAKGYTNSSNNWVAQEITWGTHTFDANGKLTVVAGSRGTYATITLPASVKIESVTAWVGGNENGYDQAFVIGNLYGYTWTNLQASNTWGNGFGMTRWTVANGSWNVGAPANQDGGSGFLIKNRADAYNLKTYNDQIALMSVVNDGTRYTLTHGSDTVLDQALTGTPSKNGADFKILHQLPGAAYGMRLYDRPLSAEQKLQNAFADLAGRYDLDVSGMSLDRLSEYGHIYSYFTATYALEGEDAGVMQDELDAMLENIATYNTLYITHGLVGLYTAFGGDASVNLSAGTWIDKISGRVATISGGSLLSRDTQGGVTTGAWSSATWQERRGLIGISLPDEYAELPTFTADVSARFFSVADGAATSYHSARTSIRFDIWGVTAFVNETGDNSHHFRGVLSKDSWGTHNGHWRDGYHTGFSKDGTSSATYVATNMTYANNAPVWLTVVKETRTDGVYFGATYNGAAFGGRTLTETAYTAISSKTGETGVGRFSVLNGNPGTVYAIRVYDRALSESERLHNHGVDLLAYFKVDISSLSAEDPYAYSRMLCEIARYDYDTVTRDSLQAIVDDYAPAPMNGYDELYVQDGLVALYTAFDPSDPSLVTDAVGNVTEWKNKVFGAKATVTGAFRPNLDGDGGFGIAQQSMAEWKAGHAFGVSFSSVYADLEDFTVENIVRYRPHTDLHPSSTDGQFDQNAVSIRYDVIAGLIWNTATTGKYRFHIRTLLTNGGWGNNSTNGTNGLRLDGGTGYCGNGYDLSENRLINHSFYKDNDGQSVFFRIAIDGQTTQNAGNFANEGKITVSQYNTIRKTSGATTPSFSTLNGSSGSLYAVRVYDRMLTEAEQAQNHAVDLIAYFNIDPALYPTDPLKQAWIAEALQGISLSEATADIVRAVLESELATVSFYKADGSLVSTGAYLVGSTLLLPEALDGETVVRWNGTTLPGTAIVISADIAFTATAACASHQFGASAVTREPTHTAVGEAHRVCSKCGTVKIEVLPALAGHEYGIWEKHDAIRHKHLCSCGEIEYAPHAYDNGRIVIAPTTDSVGLKRFLCVDCGHAYEEDIPALSASESAFTLALSSAEGKRGDTVTVTVSAQSNPGFAYMLLTLSYDTEVLTLMGVEANGSALTLGHAGNAISLDAARDYTEDGTLFTLTFRVAEDAAGGDSTVSLTVSQCFNEDTATVAAQAAEGKVSVSTVLYGDANGDDIVDGKDVIALRQYLVGNGEIEDGADANGDGLVDGKDVILLRQYLVGAAELPTA